jgi:SNF2 family DNA or RNA helicase
MINIEERRCEKLSGLTSFFLCFAYNEEIINSIKQNIHIYNYNRKTNEWEIPVTYLSIILDSLTFYDNIHIKLYEQYKDKADIEYPKLSYKLKPFKHQEEAIIYGINKDKFLLLDDMGLGKTASIIHIAEERKARREVEHCLVICGIATLRANWKKEIKIHSDETFRVIGERINKNNVPVYESINQRVKEVLSYIDEFFIIVNIETLRSTDFINALALGPNKIDMIVVDEIHICSNSKSQQGHNLARLKAKYKIAATGTLLTSAPVNAYLPLKWLDIDKSNLTNYKKQYCQFGGFGGHEIIGYKNLEILKEEIDKNSLRRTKDILKDLPEKTIIREYVTLSDEHRKFYQSVKKGVKEECNKVELNTNNLLALVTRLRQATACPKILTTEVIKSSKIDRCVELTKDLLSHNEKVVIFSSFKESVKYIADELAEFNPLLCTGDTKDSIISDNVDKFQSEDKYKVLVATYQKMGTGITLNAASYMIWIDTPFTASQFNQGCDRIYRIGTKKPVFIYNLICEHTIDERVAQIIDKKQALSDYLVDDKVTQQSIMILKEYILDL